MKKILTIILFLISLHGFSQVKQNYPQYGGTWNRLALKWNGGFQLPRSAVSTKDLNVATLDTAQIYYDPADSSIVYYTGFQSLRLRPGLSSSDTSAMLTPYLRGATAGYGMLITGSQHKTWAVDSFSVVSRAALYKVSDSLGALIGGTSGIDAVLAVGQAFGANRTMTVGGNLFFITGSSSVYTTSISNSSSGYGLNLFSTSGGALNATTNNSGVNTTFEIATFNRNTSGTAGDNIAGSISMRTQTTGGALVTSTKFISRLLVSATATATSEIDIEGINSAASEVYLRLKTGGLAIVNNLADTLSTMAYARSVGGGGGTNFANADLTFTADRFHQLDDKTLIIENGIFGQLLIDGLNRRYAFGDHAAEGNGRSLIILDTATVTPAYKMIGVQQETTSNVLYYDETTGKISYDAAPAGGGATVALDNLSSVAINAALVLGTSDAFALGSTTKHWSDLFLAEGGVINWDNGDATLTQVGNTLTYENGETFEIKTANTGVTSFQITDAGSAQYRFKIREYGGVIEGYNSTFQLYNSFSNGVLQLGGRNVGNQLTLGGTYINVKNRFSEVQGADIASAAGAIALGTDGNSFEITGTSAITLISNVDWQNGATITLWFTSTASLTDGTANSGTDIGIELAGGLNFTGSAGAGITLQLIEIGGTQRWREKSRSVN